jgi:hypothetical protein
MKTAAMQALGAQYIELYGLDEREASEFNEGIAQELSNLDYQFYSDGFGPLISHGLIFEISCYRKETVCGPYECITSKETEFDSCSNTFRYPSSSGFENLPIIYR